MASNPYVNKVQTADGSVIMDISSDTVTPSDVLNGVTFHDRSGAAQQGSVITHNVYDGLDSTSTSDALSANQGKVLNTMITTYNVGSGTLASIQTALETLGSNMSDYEERNIIFTVTTASAPFEALSYLGTFFRVISGRYIVDVSQSVSSKSGIHGVRYNNTWSWYSTNDQLASYDLGTLSSMDAFNTALTTLGNSLEIYQTKSFYFTTTFSGVFPSNTVLTGEITHVTQNRFNVIVQNHATPSYIWRGADANGSWSWSSLIVRSEFSQFSQRVTNQIALSSGSSHVITGGGSWAYCSLLLLGFVNNKGGTVMAFNCGSGGGVSATHVAGVTATDVISASYSGASLTITSSTASNYSFSGLLIASQSISSAT